MKQRKAVVAGLLLLLVASAQADDYYLELQGIPGDSKGAGHINWIDITSFEHGIDVPGDPGAGNRPAGQPTYREFRVCKEWDRSSVPIQMRTGGAAVPKATFEVVSQGRVTLRYEFTNVRLVNYHNVGRAPETPKDCVSLRYTKLKVTHVRYDDQGKPDETTFEYDLEANSGG